MALQTLTDDGHMEWNCTNCGKRQGAHHSDEAAVIHLMPGAPKNHRMVRLPTCDCGCSTSLKVDFTDKELAAPNMFLVEKDEAGNIISKRTSPSYDVAHRHMALIAKMEAAGKQPVAIPAPTNTGTVMTLIGNTLTVSVDGAVKTSFTAAEQQALLHSLQQHGIPVQTWADVEKLLNTKAPEAASGTTSDGMIIVAARAASPRGGTAG